MPRRANVYALPSGWFQGAEPAPVCVQAALSPGPAGTTAAQGWRAAKPQVQRPANRSALAEKDLIAMANILVNIEKGIELGASDALKWLADVSNGLHATPKVIAALATLVGAAEKPLSELAGAAANPLNIPLDIQTVNDLKTVWPDVKTFLGSFGVKF